MEHSSDRISAGQALAEIEHALNRIEPNRRDVVAADRLKWVRQARRIRGRIDALAGLLTAEADQAQASVQVAGTPLDAWLGTGETLTRREASGAVYQARALAAHHSVGQAASQGQIGTGQARAIGKVLTGLAPQLDATQQQAAESAMLTLATHMDADQLARSAGRVLAQVKPEVTLADDVTRRQREVEAAHQERSLRFFSEGASIRFDGSLPRLEGERWIALLNARAEARRRTALEARDRLAEATTSEQRRADAFIDLLNAAANATPEPGTGTARVIVKLDYQHLHDEAAAAGLIGLDQELSAGELRRVCCDAEIIPMVLGGASQPLDVGRASRLVTAAIRSALTVRDGGCAFPGCDVRPELCEAHHIDPWWTGASTCVANLAGCRYAHLHLDHGRIGVRRIQSCSLYDLAMALIGFWSYVHADDDTDMGRITLLAHDIVSDYEALTGEKIELFLDSDQVHWGDKWRAEVDDALSNVAFFIAVITPRYFLSVECRREFQFFLERARSLGIQELVMSLRYIDSPRLTDPAEDDPIVLAVNEFHWEDWVPYRMEERTSKEYRTAVDKLARELVRRVAEVESTDLVATVEELEANPEGEGDPGFLDRVAGMEEALPELNETMASLTAAVQDIGTFITAGTADIQRGEQQGKGFAARLTVARRVGSQLADPVNRIESLSQTFLSKVSLIDSGLRVMLPKLPEEVAEGSADRADVCEFLQTIREFSEASSSGLDSGLSMAQSTRELEGLSKDLRPPLRRLSIAMTSMSEARSIFDGWLDLINSLPIECVPA
ncbi:MAG: DUF222 domain-containing protein [Propionicimonas sp.]